MPFSTPLMLLDLLTREVQEHARAAGRDGIALLRGDGVMPDSLWPTVYSFVYSAATVASIFAPGGRREPFKSKFPERPTEMCALFGVDPSDLDGIRALRNDLAHIDERYEQFWLSDPNHNLAVRMAGPHEMLQMNGTRFHWWDPTRSELTFLGSRIDVAAATTQMGLLTQKSASVAEQLWELRMEERERD